MAENDYIMNVPRTGNVCYVHHNIAWCDTELAKIIMVVYVSLSEDCS
jgi:hypothetical protein